MIRPLFLGLALTMAPPLLVLAPAPASAQFSGPYTFLKAIEDRHKKDGKGDDAIKALKAPGSTLANSRDPGTGETALHYVIRDRDTEWVKFLLEMGTRADLADNGGTTPLMLAAQMRFGDAVELLIKEGATVDKPNSSGETPLMRAVQMDDLGIVRQLIAAGANPDKRDKLAGLSARDYAKRDRRLTTIAAELDKVKPTTPKVGVQGPGF